jgi:hypothetical protein
MTCLISAIPSYIISRNNNNNNNNLDWFHFPSYSNPAQLPGHNGWYEIAVYLIKKNTYSTQIHWLAVTMQRHIMKRFSVCGPQLHLRLPVNNSSSFTYCYNRVKIGASSYGRNIDWKWRSLLCMFSLLCIQCSLLFCDIVLLCVTVFLLCIVLFLFLVLYCVCLWCTCCYPNWGFSVLFPQL